MAHKYSAIFLVLILVFSGISFAEDAPAQTPADTSTTPQPTATPAPTPDTSTTSPVAETTPAPAITESGGQTPVAESPENLISPAPVTDVITSTEPPVTLPVSEQPILEPTPVPSEPQSPVQPPVDQQPAQQQFTPGCSPGRYLAVDGAGNCKEFSDSCTPPGWSNIGDKDCDEYKRRTGSISSENIPQGCWQEKDNSGMVRVVCKQEQRTCPAIPQDKVDSCKNNGGTPDVYIDNSGCKVVECRFEATRTENILQKNAPCPTHEDWERVSKKCADMGQKVAMTIEGGCNIPRCVPSEEQTFRETRQKSCGLLSAPERERIERDCEARGLGVVKDFDEKGCQFIRCKETKQLIISGVCAGDECKEKCFETKEFAQKCLDMISTMENAPADAIKSLKNYIANGVKPSEEKMDQVVSVQCNDIRPLLVQTHVSAST